MSKPQCRVDGLALSILTDMKHSSFKRNVIRWCKRRIGRQERRAANHFLAEVAKKQDLVFDAHADGYFGLDGYCEYQDEGNEYETLAAYYERIAYEEEEQRRQDECYAMDYGDPDEYDDHRYDPYDEYEYHDDDRCEFEYDFDRWSDHDMQERDLWNVKDMVRGLAALDFHGKINLVDGMVEVGGCYYHDGKSAAKLLERLGFRVLRLP